MFEGKAIIIKDILFRVIYESFESCVLCEMNSSKLSLCSFSTTELRRMIRSGEAEEAVDQKVIVLDMDRLTEKEKSSYERNKAIMDKISEEYGPTYLGLLGKKKKPVITYLIEKFHIDCKSIWRIIRRYLQSGLQPSGLVDLRLIDPNVSKGPRLYETKGGRKTKSGVSVGIPLTQEVRKQFEEAKKEYLSGREKTIKDAFCGLLDKHYSFQSPVTGTLEWVSEAERPTLKQFYNYCNQNLTLEEKLVAKTSKEEVRNNNRRMLSSARYEAVAPGRIAEADACECSLSIVSEIDNNQTIGKPIVYMLVDVFSGIITAVSAAFDNNSFVGLTSLMLNLAEDKISFAKRFGIEFSNPAIWPSCYIPNTIRCDRGAEFRSDKFRDACARLNINRDLEPRKTGSMKPFVEQDFNRFQKSWRSEMEHFGLITNRYDSDHNTTSMLTLYEFTQMLIGFVLISNQKVMEGYRMSPEMLKEKDFIPTPSNIWAFGCRKSGLPRQITDLNRSDYYFNLLLEQKALITRRGVKYKNLYYNNPDDTDLSKAIFAAESNAGKRMVDGRKVNDFTVRVDPRDVGHLYYLLNGKLTALNLQPLTPDEKKYSEMTWFQYDQYNEQRKKIIREGKDFNLKADASLKNFYNDVKISATKDTLSNDKGIKEARDKDKHAVSHANSIASRMEPSSSDEEKAISVEPKIEVEPETTQGTFDWSNWTPDSDIDMNEVIDDFNRRNN